MEKITDLDEAMILGYFETIKSNCYIKCLAEGILFNSKGQQNIAIPDELDNLMEKTFLDFSRFKLYYQKGNGEIQRNLNDSIISELIVGSWICFEQIIKDLTKKDYALSMSDITMDYKANKLGFSKTEQEHLDLFYYIRNAYVHYNGAYYMSKNINIIYEGNTFTSAGHEGEKINIPNLKVAYQMHLDLEKYAMNGWTNFIRISKKQTSV